MNSRSAKRLRQEAKYIARKEQLPKSEYAQVSRKITGGETVTSSIVLTRCERKIYKDLKKNYK